ncbi:MAG: PorT family protein [Bacteroidales bacterium]|nr:PorT family protein [Bacteroidales bacterium]
MKKIIFSLICFLPLLAFSQEKSKIIGETTARRVSVGVELYQDFWMNWPKGMNVHAINQGGGGFVMYNIPFGDSPVSFAIGAGLGFHNLYSNTTIENIKADTISFTVIPDSISYKKSKLGLTYLDIPLELRLVTKSKFRVSVGVKLGYLLDAKTKFKGENLAGDQIIQKNKKVDNVDKFRFGPTIRIGYNWFQVVGYFSVTKIFDKGLGPDLYPISVGITFMPF